MPSSDGTLLIAIVCLNARPACELGVGPLLIIPDELFLLTMSSVGDEQGSCLSWRQVRPIMQELPEEELGPIIALAVRPVPHGAWS